MMKLNKLLIATLIAAAAAPAAHAERLFSTSSLSLLYGDDYEAFGKKEITQSVFTFENVTVHDWGGTFLFFDRSETHGTGNDSKDIYGEFSPSMKLSWLTGQDYSMGPLADISLTGTYEYGGGADVDNALAGFALNWKLPGFSYFNTVVYRAFNSEGDDDFQLTVTWGSHFDIGAAKFLFDGYIDWSSAADDHKADFHFNPQLKLDLGNFAGNPGVFYAGIEYSYWHNKYGLGDAVMETENVVSALVKVHF